MKDNEPVTIPQAAEIASEIVGRNVPIMSMWRWIKNGRRKEKLQHVIIAGKTMTTRSLIEKFLADTEVGT
jgi:hypothetical protein